MKSAISCILASLLILFAGCSPPSQREQYEEATSGLKYNAYKNASKAAILGSTEIYNNQQPDSLQFHPPYAHLLLGYFWSISGKSSFAFAEADIVQEKANERRDPNTKSMAQTLRSLAMYQAGWHQLAKEESAKAVQNIEEDQGLKSKNEAAVFYLLMGTVYTKEKDFEKAKFFWGGFAKEAGIHWPYQICDVAADIQAGNIQQGLIKTKAISQDPTVPKLIREEFVKVIEKVEKRASASLNSSLFWPGIISKMIWEGLKNSSQESLSKVSKSIEGIGKKL